MALAAVVAAATGPAAAATPSTGRCFWSQRNDPDFVNAAFPDKAASYWAAFPFTPPGAELVFHGQFPHARYFSFNIYNEQGQPTAGLADVNIVADPGSTNPFHPGARRDVAARSYTVYIKPGPAPPSPAPNTLYLPSAGGAGGAFLLYRLYVPDRGRDSTGDVGLPEVTLVGSDGSRQDQTAACTRAGENSTIAPPLPVSVSAVYNGSSLPAPPLAFSGQNPLQWTKFFNTQHAAVSSVTGGTPAQPIVNATFAGSGGGGFLSNIDTAYVSALANRGYGTVLVVRGKAPSTPATIAGERRMRRAQLRYWSMCTNEPRSTRYVDCLYDEQAVLDRHRYYTIVVSSPQDRPLNARPACGVNWLAWGTSGETLPILRNTLPRPSFNHAIQRVAHPGEEAAVMGAYLPTGTYTSTKAFEARGCPAVRRR